uniref:Double-strand-break repair protein rad21 homolog n=1 Tax=Romanomermis culicivorax TaxID=13658 RepID=A0A915L8L2_ROMCU
MFYAQFVLSKKGPLAKIWLAAHWEKKLTKAQVFETNIDKAVESILEPKVKMALRTTGHLLLGVVRIYSRKAKYLLADCNDACVKIKLAFRPGVGVVVDLPQDAQEASLHAITLPEVFHDFDSALPEINDFDYEANQSDIGAITMKEDIPMIISNGLEDEAFGAEEGEDFDSVELSRFSDRRVTNSDFLGLGDAVNLPRPQSTGNQDQMMMVDAPDDLGDQIMDEDYFMVNTQQTWSDETAFRKPNTPPPPNDAVSPPNNRDASSTEPESSVAAVRGSLAPGMTPAFGIEAEEPMEANEPEGVRTRSKRREADSTVTLANSKLTDDRTISEVTTLIQNEKECYALMPCERTEKKSKRKRRLIVDEIKSITGEDMKLQLNDFSDTVTPLDLAPPTRKLMGYKEMSGAEKLLTTSAFPNISKQLLSILTGNLTTKHKKDDAGTIPETVEGLQLTELGISAAPTPQPEEIADELRDNFTQIQAQVTPLASIAEEPSKDKDVDEQAQRLTILNEEDQASALEHERYGAEGGPPSVSPRLEDQPEPSCHISPPPSPRKKGRSSNSAKEQVNGTSTTIEPTNEEDAFDMIMDDQDLGPLLDGSTDDRQWSSRTHQLLNTVKTKLKTKDYVNFLDLCARRDNRKIAAQKFYTLLVLKKWRSIDVEQEEPFGDIKIREGPRLNESLGCAE